MENVKNDPWRAANDTWLRRYTWGTGVVALFTVVLAGAAIQQCRMYRDSERPWLGSIERTPAVHQATGKVLSLDWKFKNGGKSPANDIRFNLILVTGEPIPEKDLKAIEPPGVAQCNSEQPLPGDGGTLLIPGAEQTFSVPSPQTVLDASDSINRNKVGLYFVGCLDYRDASGNDYRTNVCEIYVPSKGRFYSCLKGNSAK